MLGLGILSGLLILPLVGAAFILTLRGDDEAVRVERALDRARHDDRDLPRLALCLGAVRPGEPGSSSSSRTMPGSADTIRYKLGVDGISMLFVLLTTFLMPICILASLGVDRAPRQGVHDRLPGARDADDRRLRALDLVLFYVFFEAGLIPMFLIIGIWGGKRRVYASFKFFLYTLLGSVLMLLAILAMYWHAGTTDIPTLLAAPTSRRSCRPGCGSPSSPPSRSRCRCGRSTPGCPTRTSRRRPRAR